MTAEILQPVAVLAAWTLLVLAYTVAVRLPAMKRAGIDIKTVRGSKPGVLDNVLPAETQWPAHNYMHLVEQPTLFYAVALLLAMIDQGDGLNALIAWAYVLLRIAHSFVQIFGNVIRFRFMLFALATLALAALVVHALIAVF